MSKTAMACFCLLIWGIRISLPTVIQAEGGIDPANVMNLINNERTQRQLPALAANSKLNAAATAKSRDMLNRDYFAHVDPDGKYVWPRIEAAGYSPYSTLGENLAMDFASAETTVTAWMNSPTHRANILNQKFKEQGLSALLGEFNSKETIMTTSLFGALKLSTGSTSTPQTVKKSPAMPTSIAKITPTPSPIVKSTEVTETTKTEPVPFLSAGNLPEQQPSKPIPVSNQAQTSKLMQIIAAVIAACYLFFVLLDAVIIHRAKIIREHLKSSPHALLLGLTIIVNLFFTLR